MPTPPQMQQPLPWMTGGPGGHGVVPQDLIQLEMLRLLKDIRKERRSGDDGGSDDSTDAGGKTKKLSREFKGVEKARRRFEPHPEEITRRYLKRIAVDFGVSDASQCWQPKDYSTKLLPVFGRMKGLRRAPHAVS